MKKGFQNYFFFKLTVTALKNVKVSYWERIQGLRQGNHPQVLAKHHNSLAEFASQKASGLTGCIIFILVTYRSTLCKIRGVPVRKTPCSIKGPFQSHCLVHLLYQLPPIHPIDVVLPIDIC